MTAIPSYASSRSFRQRSLIILREWITQYSRFVHRLRHSPAAPNPYALGRHGMSQHRVKIDESNVQECAHGWIAKFAYSPWPECLQRKLQIGKRIPKDHLERRMGTQHNTTVEKLSQERNASIAQSFELTTTSPLCRRSPVAHGAACSVLCHAPRAHIQE